MRELNIDNLTNKLAIVADNFDNYHSGTNKAECQLTFDRIFKTLTNSQLTTNEIQKIINDIEIIVNETFIAGQEEILDE